MDYAEIGDEGGDREQARKILVGRERDSKSIFCHLVKRKGLDDEGIVTKVCDSIKEFGLTAIELKTDGEPALVQVQQAIAEQRGHPTVPVNPPAYDPQANGTAERAVQEIKKPAQGY